MPYAFNPFTDALDYHANVSKDAHVQLVDTGNISVGDSQTMDSITTGTKNTVLGAQSGTSLADGEDNVLVGYNSGQFLSSGDDCVFIGHFSGYYQVSAEDCVMIGTSAGSSGVDTTRATYIGYTAGSKINGGDANTFIGYYSGTGQSFVSGTSDGDTADHLIDSTENFDADGIVKIGMTIQNRDEDTETTITAVDDGDLTLTASIFNLGGGTGGEAYRILTARGGYNVGVGRKTLYEVSSGSFNTAVGNGAGIAIRSGNDNVLIGNEAGELLTDEDNNIFLGYRAGTWHKLSDRLIIDGHTRTNQAEEITNAIIYGVMSANPTSQTLTINAAANIGAGANRVEIDNTGSTTFNGTARIDWAKVTAASITQGTGDHSGTTGDTSGLVGDLSTAFDGNYYHIDEVAAGFDVIVHFTGVTAFNWVQCICNYQGSVSHAVMVQAYNWNTTTWDSYKIVPAAVDEFGAGINTQGDSGFFVPDDINYVGTGGDVGKVDIRLLHSTAGNANHDFDVDCVALYQ
jgi:hypothetical protein